MALSELATARAACAYFFVCPGLSYGILTSRLPALKGRTGADDAQIGLALLCLGGASLMALAASGWILDRWGSRSVLRVGSLVLPAAIIACGLAPSPLLLGAACILTGFSLGLMEVAMNTQGIRVEHRYAVSCMSFLHAAYSLGGVLGAVTGVVFAGLGLSPAVNAACALGLFVCFRSWAVPRLLPDSPSKAEKRRRGASLGNYPRFVVLCGVMAMMVYAAEGSVAEWGSLLLFSVKGAGESTAASVFAVFSGVTVVCRLFGDRLRSLLGDFVLMLGGGALAAGGMAIVLCSPHAAVCLAGYALMGLGLSPIVPLLFSRAGSHPGISPSRASAIVSLLAYSGLLFFPPLLGFLSHGYGLEKALLVALACCLLVTGGAFLVKGGPGAGQSLPD